MHGLTPRLNARSDSSTVLTEPCDSRSPGGDTVRPAACSLLVLTEPQSSTPGRASVGVGLRLTPLAAVPSACPHLCRSVLKKVLREKVGFRLRGSGDCPGSSDVSTLQDRTTVPLSRGQPAACQTPGGSQDSAQSERKVPSGIFELQSREWQGLRHTKGNKEMSKRHVSKQ